MEPTSSGRRPSQSNIPESIEDRLKRFHKLKERDSTSILKFLSSLHDLNIIAEDSFPTIFEKVAHLQGDKLLLRIVCEAPDKSALTFQFVSRKILDSTSLKVRRDYQRYIFRPQRPNENFRDFVKDIVKYSTILQTHEPGEVVQAILASANDHTRTNFQFQIMPTDMKELESLIVHVEKLEKHRGNFHKWGQGSHS